jgi:hypothetical protein
MIELFVFINGQLSKNKNINNDIGNTEILCITFNPLSFFFCGHKNGNISAWSYNESTTLALQDISKIHDGV